MENIHKHVGLDIQKKAYNRIYYSLVKRMLNMSTRYIFYSKQFICYRSTILLTQHSDSLKAKKGKTQY